MKEELLKLKKECEEIRGRWNGDEGGYQEEQASIASELIIKADEMLDLIDEFDVEQKDKNIKDLEKMNLELTQEIDEQLRVIIDATTKIKGSSQVIKDNREEIETLKTNLEGYEALRQ